MDVSKMIYLSSYEIFIKPSELKLNQDNASLQCFCLQYFLHK